MKTILLISLCSIQLLAKTDSYTAPITRDQQTESRLVYNFWSGEYPMPVIDVSTSKAGETTILGYTTLRDLKKENQRKCTVENGTYHPWAEKKSKSLLEMYTVLQNDKYDVLGAHDFPEAMDLGTKKRTSLKVSINDKIDNVVYLSEGICQFRVVQKNKIYEVEDNCDTLEQKKSFKKISKNTEFKEQWLYLLCKELDENKKPLKVFVQDSDLLKQSGVQSGCVLVYGKVGAGKQCDQAEKN